MRIRAYAVVCKRGKVHKDGGRYCVFLDKREAKDTLVEWDRVGADLYAWACSPHRVITLSGEVSLLGGRDAR